MARLYQMKYVDDTDAEDWRCQTLALNYEGFTRQHFYDARDRINALLDDRFRLRACLHVLAKSPSEWQDFMWKNGITPTEEQEPESWLNAIIHAALNGLVEPPRHNDSEGVETK